MGQGKHFSSLGILVVDENQRRILVNQDKSAKFLHIQASMSIVPDDSIEDYQDTCLLQSMPQKIQCILPTGMRGSPIIVQAQNLPHLCSHSCWKGFNIQGANKRKWLMAQFHKIFPQPILPPLHSIHRLEQVGTWPSYLAVT
jgi:hypothetical protein